MSVKQIICIRKDLKMRRGKEISQGSHGVMMWLLKRMKEQGENFNPEHSFTNDELEWINGKFTKICCYVNSEEELLELHKKALNAGLLSNLVTDAGLTEFGGKATNTCICIGPDNSEEIDKITSHLKLY